MLFTSGLLYANTASHFFITFVVGAVLSVIAFVFFDEQALGEDYELVAVGLWPMEYFIPNSPERTWKMGLTLFKISERPKLMA